VNPITEKVKELIRQLDETTMQNHIEKLTSWGPHPTARKIPYKLSNSRIIGKLFDLPIEKVAKYICSEFESMGLEVRKQYWEDDLTIANLVRPWIAGWEYAEINYRFGWHVGDNIEATLPGTDKSSDEIYVVCAHYDTVPEAPGATDDSSGVAAVLAAAKLMSQYSFNHTVRFLAVSGHEQWTLGSNAYAEEAVKNNDNIVAVLNVDMIGTQGPDYRDTEVICFYREQSRWIGEFSANVQQRHPEYLNITVLMSEGGGVSDHLEFIDKGYDAVFFEEARRDPDRHRPTDTVENMDIPYTTQIAKFVLATLAELAWDVDME